MKFVKGISLFFIYPAAMFSIGFYVGVQSMHFFYPGTNPVQDVRELSEEDWPGQIADKLEDSALGDAGAGYQDGQQNQSFYENSGQSDGGLTYPDGQSDSAGSTAWQEQNALVDAAASGDTLSVDTEYVLEETDVISHSVVETVSRLPGKYVGLNREQFVASMEDYELSPPLSELERGFVSLEVLSFSRERVVIQMNYQYVQPSASFYLAVRDNEVVVYLEDKETVYINTGIRLEELPETVQQEIMQMLWMENEETLYHFLENYSS